MENINSSYFEGNYKHIWKAIIPGDLSKKEVDFLISFFKLNEKSHVLDLMCGYGRHALELGRNGIRVTAVDNLEDYYQELKSTAEMESLPVTAVKSDALDFSSNDKYDLAICMGNSLNFFNEADTTRILTNLHKMMKPGGGLFINTWSLTEIVAKEFREHYWSHVGQLKQLNEGKYLFNPTRIEWETWIISPDNQTEHRRGVDFIFSVAEMRKILANSGFELKIVFSIPGRKEFTLGDQRAYLVAKALS